MQSNEFTMFCGLLDDAYELIGAGERKTLSGNAKALFFAALANYSLASIQAALTAHCLNPVRGRFLPNPADLIAQLDALAAKDERPGADEAWALALCSHDERDTVIWTSEIAQAFALCQPVLQRGDEVGARLAFKEAYQRLVNAARAKGQEANWIVSLGWDASKRGHVMEQAMQQGLLAREEALPLQRQQGFFDDVITYEEATNAATSEELAQLAHVQALLAQGDAIRAHNNAKRSAEQQASTLAQKQQVQAAMEQFAQRSIQQKQ